MSPELWKACYPTRSRTRSKYPGTRPYDADSDGDGILDGADDQDFDDVPNIMELSRNMAGDRADPGSVRQPGRGAVRRAADARRSSTRSTRACRTATRAPARATRRSATAYPPFDPDWEPTILN